MTRPARRLMRRSSLAKRSGSPVSQPSESTITIVRRSTRWGQSRLIWARDSPIFVAPAPPHGSPTTREAMREPSRDLEREPEDLVELVGAEGREVLADERFGVGRRRHAERFVRVAGLVGVAPGLEGETLARLARRPE